MENQSSNVLDDFATTEQKPRRRALLSLWIKTFSWNFLITGAFATASFVIGFFGLEVNLFLYGLNTFDSQSTTALILGGIFLLKAIVGFGLWMERIGQSRSE